MTPEFEHQIRQRIIEIEKLIKISSDDVTSRYRAVLVDELERLRKELTSLAPLENDSYLKDEYQIDSFEVSEPGVQGAFEQFDEDAPKKHKD